MTQTCNLWVTRQMHQMQTKPVLTRCHPFSVHKCNAKCTSIPLRGLKRFSCLQIPLALIMGSFRALLLKIFWVISRTARLHPISHRMLLQGDSECTVGVERVSLSWLRCPRGIFSYRGERSWCFLPDARGPVTPHPGWMEETHPTVGEMDRTEGMGTDGWSKLGAGRGWWREGEWCNSLHTGLNPSWGARWSRKLFEVYFNKFAQILKRFLIK